MKKVSIAFLLILTTLLASSCSESELNQNAAPVDLIATATQDVSLIDILNPPGVVGQILLRAMSKQANPVDTRFLDVKLTHYRVSYRRTDGGTLVPNPLVRSTSGIVPVGGNSVPLNNFVLLETAQVRQAPFAALLPQNGGRDPETGRTTVKMDVIVDIFGETLAGADVSARVIQEFTFCAACS